MAWLVLSQPQAVLTCLAAATLFVESLYIWHLNPFGLFKKPLLSPTLSRDDPRVIRRRFISIILVSCLSPLFLFVWQSGDTPPQFKQAGLNPSIATWMGFVFGPSTLLAIFLPLALVVVLFLGPMCLLAMDVYDEVQQMKAYTDGESTISTVVSVLRQDVDCTWILSRNLIVAPVSEEIVFRGAIVPLLVAAGFNFSTVVFAAPMFFGVAHLHHFFEKMKTIGKANALLAVVFQMTYTTVFGSFCAYVFLQTGQVLPPILCHTFCNWMGFPRFDRIIRHRQRTVLMVATVLGLAGFIYLLPKATDPTLYLSLYHSIYALSH